MNKNKFHKQLALYLGYQRIVNNKHIYIVIDDKQYPDDMIISISVKDFSKPISYNASEDLSQMTWTDLAIMDMKIKKNIDAVHQAYIEITKEQFLSYTK